jgi:hypothetical protein
MADPQPETQPEVPPQTQPEIRPETTSAKPEAECFWSSAFGIVVTEASLLETARQLCRVRDGFTPWVRPLRTTVAPAQPIAPDTTKLVGIEEWRGDPLRAVGVGAEHDGARVVLLFSKLNPYATLWHAGLDERERVYAESIAKKHLRSRRAALYWWLSPICARITRSWIGIIVLSIVGTFGLLWMHLRFGWNKTLDSLPGWLNFASYLILPALIFRGALDFIGFLFPPIQFVTGDEGKWLHAVRIAVRMLLLGILVKELIVRVFSGQ